MAPPHLTRFWVNVLVWGSLYGVIWGLVMWLVAWRTSPIDIARAFLMILVAGSLFGALQALYYRHGRRKHDLPSWSEFDVAEPDTPQRGSAASVYDDGWVHLDAEDLAEEGIGKAYRELLPRLGEHVVQPLELTEIADHDLPSYAIRAGGVDYVIYSPSLGDSEAHSWQRATNAFFQCVNAQLAHTSVRFYAINGGNDLSGLFLTPAQAEAARAALPRRSDWPYLPDDRPPWFGQFH